METVGAEECMRPILKLCCVILCLAGGLGSVRADTLDRIVAVVNGDIILYSELKEQVRLLTKMSPEVKLDDPSKRTQLERELLQQMIRERLADQEIKRLKIVVTPREIDEALDTIKKENRFTDAQFDYVIQQEGQTREQFRQGIKKEMEHSRLVERVLKSKTIVTPDQIDTYLKSEQSGFGEKRRLAIIFLPFSEGSEGQKTEEADKRARDLLNRLKGGEDFFKLAKEYSKGPAAQDGGDIGYLAVDELAPPMAAAIRGLKTNDLTDLITTPSGYFIVKVLDVQKEKPSTVDASTREKAQRQLLQLEINRKFQDWVRDLESRAFIQISL
jgi:peptidyl-prolyl cis-trans isomerase SurA